METNAKLNENTARIRADIGAQKTVLALLCVALKGADRSVTDGMMKNFDKIIGLPSDVVGGDALMGSLLQAHSYLKECLADPFPGQEKQPQATEMKPLLQLLRGEGARENESPPESRG